MKIIKLWCYICAYVQYIFLKCIYGSKLKIGKRVTWRQGFSVMIAESGKIEIGEYCFFNNYCSLNSNQKIKIGSGSIFGENVKIYDHNHRFSDPSIDIKSQGFSNGEVLIGNHCWIGSNVTILKGSKIGDNCVIGAGCVISCEVPSGTVVRNHTVLDFEKIR
ncbi:MAG: acyltransferase [Clostridia bacterium]|nr:acyltransferase [Clostridia bacterium]